MYHLKCDSLFSLLVKTGCLSGLPTTRKIEIFKLAPFSTLNEIEVLFVKNKERVDIGLQLALSGTQKISVCLEIVNLKFGHINIRTTMYLTLLKFERLRLPVTSLRSFKMTHLNVL